MNVKAWLIFGSHAGRIEEQVQDYIDRGGQIISVSIAYGPPPAKVEGSAYAPGKSWHALVVLDTEGLRDA
jgi:hypothetical protein